MVPHVFVNPSLESNKNSRLFKLIIGIKFFGHMCNCKHNEILLFYIRSFLLFLSSFLSLSKSGLLDYPFTGVP